MQRKTRRQWLWISIASAVLTAAAIVPMVVLADRNDASFTATLYSDVIRFEADGAASLRVQVFDLAENELWDSDTVAGDTVDWDRTNTRGERLANGYYLYLAQGWDASDTLILNKAGKVVLLPGNQVELRAAPVIGAIVGSGDDPVMSPMLHTIAEDLQVNGTITATEAGSASGALAVQAGPTGSRSKFTLTGYAPGASGDFASFIMRTDNQDAVFSVKDVSADTWHSAFDFEYLNALFDFKGNEVNNVGRLGVGTTTPNEQLEITGNFRLPATTATTGIIYSGGNPFIHNYGSWNTFVGEDAGNFSMTGYGNTAVGEYAFDENTTGAWNTAVGYDALDRNESGHYNTAVGSNALDYNTASDNTAVGHSALDTNVTGWRNTALGSESDVSTANLFNATAIGYAAIVDASNKVRIGNTFVTAVEIAGIHGSITSGGIAVYVNSNGLLVTTTSSARFKTGITDLGSRSDVLYDLRPVTFQYRPEIDPAGITQYGLIAEEVAEVAPDLVINDENGDPYTVRYEQLVPMLLNELQELRAEVEALKQAVASMRD